MAVVPRLLGSISFARATAKIPTRLQLCRGRLISNCSPPYRSQSSLSLPWNWMRSRKKSSRDEPLVPTPHPVGAVATIGSPPSELTASSQTTENEQQLEKFIPVTRRMLVRKLIEEEGLLSWQERRLVDSLAAAIDAYFSQRFYAILEETKLLYDPLDPDKDTIRAQQMSKKDMLDTEYWLLQKIEKLLDKSNYFKIPPSKLREVLREHDLDGLRVFVDPNDYETLAMWTRGRVMDKTSRFQQLRSSVKGYFGVKTTPPQELFTRVFVAVRTKSDKKLRLKIFKEVPCNKLEHLLPNGRIMMSNFDKGFLASSVIVGATAIALRSLPMLADKMQWTWIGLGLAGLVASRAWIGYKNKRNHYLVNLSRTLYYKSVAHNRGVLTLLTDRAQDEEFKEAILSYIFLLSPLNRRGIPGTQHTAQDPIYDTPESLRERINQWLLRTFDMKDFQFDVKDGVDKLQAMGLLLERGDGTLTVRGLEEALGMLPEPTYHWKARGALRDTESADEPLVGATQESIPVVSGGWR